MQTIDHPLADGAGLEWATEWGEDREFGPFAITEVPAAINNEFVRQKWRYVPPGSFVMGSPKEEPGRWDFEGPQHRVTLTRGFWVADTPCTQALWTAVMGSNPSRFVDPRRPVERVSWNDVQSFLNELNKRLPELKATLPTEAQWEYACRAGSKTALYPIDGTTGEIEILGENNAPALDPIAWYGGNSGVDFDLMEAEPSGGWPNKQYQHSRAGTRPVGQKKPNEWGLYDMLGNVWEWCADGFRSYSATAVVDPEGVGVGSRCIRGGSWFHHARIVRCAYRYQYRAEGQVGSQGFRLFRVQA